MSDDQEQAAEYRMWWYKDEDGDVIGPNPGGHMHHWIEAGHFDQETMVSCNEIDWAAWKNVVDTVPHWSPDDDDDDDDDDDGDKEEEKEEDQEEDNIGIEQLPRASSKRASVIRVQSEDGSSYFYDDPDLGGSGKTSWDLEELENAQEPPAHVTIATELEDENKKDEKGQTKEQVKDSTSSRAARVRRLSQKGIKPSNQMENAKDTSKEKGTMETKTKKTEEIQREEAKVSATTKQSKNVRAQRAGRRRSVFLQKEISRIVERDRSMLEEDKALMKKPATTKEETELRKEWSLPKRICDEEGTKPGQMEFPKNTKMTTNDGEIIFFSQHLNGTKHTTIKGVEMYEYTDGVKFQINVDGSTIRRDPEGYMTQTTAAGVQVWQNPEGFRRQLNTDKSVLQVHPNGHRLTLHDTGLVLFSYPSGKKIQYNADGGQILQMPNKGPMVQWMKGGLVVVSQINRKTQQMIDGSVIVQNSEEGWVCQIDKDGTEIVVFNDGSRFEKRTDGSTLERDSKNTVTQTLSDGIIIRVFEDGIREQYNENGTKLTMHTDGTMIQEETDGTIVEKRPDGTIKQTNADGTIIEK